MRHRFPLAAALLALGPASMHAADHRDAPQIAEGATTDLGDLYVFQSLEDPARTVLALTVNPFTVPGINAFFSPSALYEFKIDHDGDAVEDLVVQASFQGAGRSQTFEVRGPARPRSVGRESKPLGGAAAMAGPTGEALETSTLRVFAGLRDDPFFFDQQAFFVAQQLRRPGVDFYQGKNVSAIVVELPAASLLGKGASIRVWATVSRLHGGRYMQQDRLGLPAINVVLVPSAARDDYNLSVPRDDVKKYAPGLKQTLEALGLDSAARDALGGALLPDTLVYDPSKPQGFLNGRRPGDDVIDAVLGLLASKGAAVPADAAGKPTDHVDANDVPFLKVFPYLAPPHAAD